MLSAPLEAAVSRDGCGCVEEFVRGRSVHLFKLALLLTGQSQAEAEDLLQIALERAYRRRAWLSRDRDPEPYVRRALVATVPVGRVPAAVGTDPQTRLSGCGGRGPEHIHC
jgi:DNA-directed RNA polymerase specialized sigma24 family protein